MGLRKLLRLKRSKPVSPKSEIQSPETKETAPISTEKKEQYPKVNANVVFPFHDVKTTSFPPPLSIDASVFTDPHTPLGVHPEVKKNQVSMTEDTGKKEVSQVDEPERKDEAKDDKAKNSRADDTCDSVTCPKEGCTIEAFRSTHKKQYDSEDKISSGKLTEMINTSIKEAMETIVKQCRMEEDKTGEKKAKEKLVKSICYSKKDEPSIKVKHNHRPQINRPNLVNHCLKSNRLQDKHNRVRPCSKTFHEDIIKKIKKDEIDDSKSKRHSKPTSNVRTDNRRMTGNVNIYICSEATENAQAISKQKEPQPCAETSSETTTDRSNISSSKLVTSIRRKRRKSKEQNCFDALSRREQSSDSCSCVSKYTDSNTATKLESNDGICNVPDENLSAKDTDSTLVEYKYDTDISNSDVTDKSDLSFRRPAKFVVCDKLEKPYTPSKMSTSSDSDQWSFKTLCNNVERLNYSQNREHCFDQHQVIGRERVLCNKNRNETWSMESKTSDSNSHTSSVKQDHDMTKDDSYKPYIKTCSRATCKCKKDHELFVDCDDWSTQNNYRPKRHSIKIMGKENSMQPWSTCSCITEEEEDACVEEKPELTVCERPIKQMQEEMTVCGKDTSKDVPRKKLSVENLKEFNQDANVLKEEEKKEVSEKEEEKKEVSEKEEEKKEVSEKEEEKKEVSEKEAEKIQVEADTESKLIEQDKQQKDEEQKKEILQKGLTAYAYQRSLRPEARVLKQLLKQQAKPQVQTIVEANVKPAQPIPQAANSSEPSSTNGNNPQSVTKAEPAFLKKFNLRGHYNKLYNPAEQAATDQSNQAPDQETIKTKSEEKNDQKQEIGEGKQKGKGFPERLRNSFLYKGLQKVIGRTESPETKTEESVVKDKITEDAPVDVDKDKKDETPQTKSDTLEASINPKIAAKDTYKDKFIPIKMDLKKINKTREKPGPSTDNSSKIVKDQENKEVVKDVTKTTDLIHENAVEKEKQKEAISDDTNEKQSKLKLPNVLISKTSLPINKSSTDLTKVKSAESPRKMKIQKIIKPPVAVEVEKKIEIKEAKDSVSPSREGIQEKGESSAKERYSLEKGKDAVRVPCVQRSLSEREAMHSTVSPYIQFYESESHTVCKNCGAGQSMPIDKRHENSDCDCCHRPILEGNDRPSSYPKSCLKKKRQFYQISSHASCSIPCHENKKWEECSCRQRLLCNGCCRPRNECRRTITCLNCCKPENDCNCKPTVYQIMNPCRCIKSMVCLYCDKPREKCTCKAPLPKCSCCQLSADLCVCKDQETFCDGRPVLIEPDNDRTMYVTAWKPREEVRRYFSRNLKDLRADSTDECCCHEKIKPHNSDDLPYQRLSVFSDVMNELQQKISESTCCTRCRRIPCCCNVKNEKAERSEEREIKYCVSPNTRRKNMTVCVEKLKSKSPNCSKRESNYMKSDRQKTIAVPICCACEAKPCRCARKKSSPKKPKAKCYYCKSSPCVCIAARERSKPRLCRCADSPCRTKEKEIVPCGKTSTKPRNNEEKIICVR